MRRSFLSVVALFGSLIGVQSADGVWIEDRYHEVRRGYHRNEAWPWPYICPDRVAVREPFAAMVNNGWRRQNLLGTHHFNMETNQLTTAGQLRVHWIMTQARPNGETSSSNDRTIPR